MVNRHEFKLHEWMEQTFGSVLSSVNEQIETIDQETETIKAVKQYWLSFAKNTINMCEVMSYLPQCYPQVIMSFRLLQETSADIYYLKNNKDNISNLAQRINEARTIIESGYTTLRSMANTIVETDVRGDARPHGTQARLVTANQYIGEVLDERLVNDLGDINKILNGYSHFNPTAIYWQDQLTNYGYFEVYMKLLHFYPAWLFLVLVSMSDLLEIDSLNFETSTTISNDLLAEIEKTENWKSVVLKSGNR